MAATERANFEFLRVAADEGPLTSFGEVVLRGPAPVAGSEDGRGRAVVLLGNLNGAFAAELVVR